MSPTQRSLKYLRAQGFDAVVVERWNQFAKRKGGGRGVRIDLFGFGDILGFSVAKKINLIVQACNYTDMARRRQKIVENAKAVRWLKVPTNKICIHGWKKTITKSRVRPVYELKMEEVTNNF